MFELICMFSLFPLVIPHKQPKSWNVLNPPGRAPGNTTASVGIWNEALFGQHPEPSIKRIPGGFRWIFLVDMGFI